MIMANARGKNSKFCIAVGRVMPRIHYTRFSVTQQTILTCQDAANKSATSRCNGIWEMTWHNRHHRLLPVPLCYGLDTGKLV